MNQLLIMFTIFSFLLGCQPTKLQLETNFYALEATTLNGEPFQFNQLRGKKVIIVNTASKCGYTGQYKELQALHERYPDKLVILGFPCNQFLWQESGSASEIANFCTLNYGVSFQLMQKADVKGKNQQAVYQWLTRTDLNGWNKQMPKWNFCKYLIDETGKLVQFYPSKISPTDPLIINWIEE